MSSVQEERSGDLLTADREDLETCLPPMSTSEDKSTRKSHMKKPDHFHVRTGTLKLFDLPRLRGGETTAEGNLKHGLF